MKKLTLTITAFLLLFCGEVLAQEKDYYVESKAYSANPEKDPPWYAKQLDETGIAEFKNINWIEAGINYRARFEHRDNDYRRSIDNVDDPILSRTQAYFGIKNIIDPLRFAIEIQDSRRHNSKFARSTADINKLDLFQGYGELYFEKPILFDRPLSLRVGRMAFEVLDRKLIARDDWGNTGTNFQGFRMLIGKKENDWQIDSFALRPVMKSLEEGDQGNKNQWVYGGILNWRRWSDHITIQPFYLKLSQERSATTISRNIDSPGLRLDGTFGANKNYDYNLMGIYQFGENNGQVHRASAYTAELGYTYEHQWQPRLSLIYGYASGDKNPRDGKNQRFERFYGFNRPWSNSNHIEWENLQTVKGRIEVRPNEKWYLEGSYGHYWLASSTDIWTRANLQDPTGASGKDMGKDFDARIHYYPTKNLRTTLGYAHFIPGDFTKNVSGRSEASDFLYLEITVSLFGR